MRFFVFLAALFISASVHAQSLTIDLSEDRVDITTGFDGTDIIIYGIKEGAGEIAMTLIGPERTMVVRRKSQVLGAWINADSVEFHRVPGYYDYALSAPVNAKIASAHDIGLDALGFYHEERLSDSDEKRFRDALIRNKQGQGLYPLQGRVVSKLEPGFFKAVFPLPANVPSGLYKVEAFLVQGEQVKARASDSLQVGQVGFSARIYMFAHERGLFYGLMTIALAFVAGWGAFTFLRRD